MKSSVKLYPDLLSKGIVFSSDLPPRSPLKMPLFLELALPHILSAAPAVLQTALEYLFLRPLSFFPAISSSFHISERISFYHLEFPQAHCKTKEIIRNHCAGGCFSGYVCIWSNTVVSNTNTVGFCLALCYLLQLWTSRFLLPVTWYTNSHWIIWSKLKEQEFNFESPWESREEIARLPML